MKRSAPSRRDASMLARSMQIVRYIVENDEPLTQGHLARQLKIPVGTLHRLLADLESQQWIIHDREACRIEAGPSLINLSAAISQRYGVSQAIRPLIRSLVEKTGETVCLNLYDKPADRLTLYMVETSDQPLSYHLSPGESSYLHSGASGRAAMAFLQKKQFDKVINRHGLPAVTASTITSLTKLRRELEATRRAGYAFSEGERLDQAVGIAAPVFGTSGLIAGSLLVTIPKFRFLKKQKAAIAKAVKDCAAQLKPFVELIHGNT